MARDPIVTSLRAYQRLLRLYPPRFRAEFGEEMLRVFGDACRDGYRHGGARGVARVWLQTMPDVVVSVVDEHAEEDFAMARTQLARVLSIAGFAAGALWIAYALLANMRAPGILNGPSRDLDDIGILFIAGFPFLAASLIAAHLRLATVWPASIKLVILLAVGGIVWILLLSPIRDDYWTVFVTGYFIMDIGFLLAGILLWTQRGMQPYAALFSAIGVCCLLFNTEDMRVLFAAAAGILIIALSALIFQGMSNRQGEPPLSA
jgi:hypothetical protein